VRGWAAMRDPSRCPGRPARPTPGGGGVLLLVALTAAAVLAAPHAQALRDQVTAAGLPALRLPRLSAPAAPAPAPPPPRPPSARALAGNPRLATTTAHGCEPRGDLASGRLDPRVTTLLAMITTRYAIRVSCVRTGHSYYVKGTRRVSNHTVWRAVDLDQVNRRPVHQGNQAARELTLWLGRLPPPLRPAEVGSPWPLGRRPYFSDAGHQGHLHIGYRAPRGGGG
jgi:hypothetical protein